MASTSILQQLQAHFMFLSSANSEELAFVSGQYQPALVLLSVTVAVVLSWVALHTADIARHMRNRRYYHLAIAMATVALGGGIWTMHFIGMLAYRLPAPVDYSMGLTIISVIPACAASWLALNKLAQHELPPVQLMVSGVLVGAGIGAMHYLGMAAMMTPLEMRYVPSIFALSIVVAVALAMLALWVHSGLGRTALHPWLRFILGGLVMGAAIAGMHYTGMSAARFAEQPNMAADVTSSAQPYTALLLAAFAILVGALVAAVNGLLRSREFLVTAVGSLERIAQADLSEPVEIRGRNEMAQLFTAIRDMQQQLAAIVAETWHHADSVSTGVSEMTAGNDELSNRTQQQAASLEQTTASMEQMTSTVQQNADNATQANELTQSVRKRTEEGTQVINQAVSAMSEIDAVSQKITRIVGLIEDIAFQTNLLALNAAVEAARAGEQGRGFAVVASEVRNLASRSSVAAKDVNDLVTDSTEKVQEGSRQVGLSGQVFDDIVESINQVDHIVSEIAAASSEQSSGIEQINLAVTQMDNTTQQNASLVEQSAAASRSLDEQAEALKRQVAFFKLANNENGEGKALPASV